jgi:starvation-inducible outer membrane lipoprotein
MVTITFTGTKIDLYIDKGTNLGMMHVNLDGTAEPDISEWNSGGVLPNVLGFSSGPLASGPHTLTLTVAGVADPGNTTPTAATDIFIDVDDIQVTS